MSRRRTLLTVVGGMVAAVLSGFALAELLEPASQTRRIWGQWRPNAEQGEFKFEWMRQ
jgi:hypothetical protein